MKPILISLLLAVAAPSFAVEFDASVAQGMVLARSAAESADDLALSSLYQRLFVLQDKRRDTEMRSDDAELSIEELALAYLKHDDRMTAERLKEIAADPEHRDYPNITEREKLQIMVSVREKLRVQKLAVLELKRIARDADEVKALIAENLARRPK